MYFPLGGWEQISFPYRKPLPSVPQDAADSIQINDQAKKGKSNVTIEMDEHIHCPDLWLNFILEEYSI